MSNYKEVTAEYALTQFAVNGVNKNIRMIHEGKEFYIEEITISVCFAVLAIDVEFGMALSREEAKQKKWVEYE